MKQDDDHGREKQWKKNRRQYLLGGEAVGVVGEGDRERLPGRGALVGGGAGEEARHGKEGSGSKMRCRHGAVAEAFSGGWGWANDL